MEFLHKPTSRTLRVQVVDILRNAIVSGQLKPGEHLKEGVIEEQLAVSRSPIREALRQLEQEGLIVSIPNQGSFVRRFDEQDVWEIFTLRTALEDLACELLLRNGQIPSSDLAELQELIDQQDAAYRAEDWSTLASLDMEFHELIVSKSGSGRLLRMWQRLRLQIQMLFCERWRALDQVPLSVSPNHSAILEALRQGDLDQISRLNKEINAGVAQVCLQVLGLTGAQQSAESDTGMGTADSAPEPAEQKRPSLHAG